MEMLTGQQIKELREALGDTMAVFGKRLGVSEASISYWEKGERHPKWKTMVELNRLWNDAKNGNGAAAKPGKKVMAK